MGYAQDLLDEIEREKYLSRQEKELLENERRVEQEVEESLRNAIQQELDGNVDYNRSAQRLIDVSHSSDSD
jgi:hypothetical protein